MTICKLIKNNDINENVIVLLNRLGTVELV